MIKFDTINGTLCRMVEPEPLTDKSQFPCVVRLIQDDSPMGRYNRNTWLTSQLQEIQICKKLIAYCVNELVDNEFYHFEIIGHPVEEGSAEWALWQMEQGKKVCHKSYMMKTTHCAINDESQVVIFTTPYSVANGGDVVCHANEWLDHRQYGCGVDERTGWQLYEPEPEPESKPPDFKVGDWVEYSDGTLQQAIIEAYSGQPGKQMVYVWHPQTAHSAKTPLQSITRKLDPSEVKISVTLEGTVSKDCAETLDNFILNNADGHTRNRIKLSTIDPAAAELVRELVAKQEEE